MLAPAKINLDLRVFPPTPDGFHPLRSWFRTVNLHDELTFTRLDEAPHDVDYEYAWTIDLQGVPPELPGGSQNSIVEAWDEAHRAGAVADPLFCRVDLTKRIFAGGGLGGGSSDAAATLASFDQMYARLGRTPLDRKGLFWTAGFVGSDVPFFLSHHLDGTTDATVTGRGEIIEPFTPARRHAVLLILPGLHVATPSVFKRFDQFPPPPERETPEYAAWSALPALELLPLLQNDLERPAFDLHPSLGELRQACEQTLGRPVRMTGSGSTLFTLYDDADEAATAIGSLPAGVRGHVG